MSLPNLPPLTKKISRGSEGGNEFARIVKHLMLFDAERNDYVFTGPDDASGDYRGVDGFVEMDMPGRPGPVGFHFKWLSGKLRGVKNSTQIKNSILNAKKQFTDLKRLIIVTPQNIKKHDAEWLSNLKKELDLFFELEHWGHEELMNLFIKAPPLAAYYYPELLHNQQLFPDFYFNEFSTIQKKFLHQLCTLFEYIRFIGIPDPKEKRDVPLKDVFVPLEFKSYGKEVEGRINIKELLNKNENWVILGDPGSGKSTLLYFLILLFGRQASLKGWRKIKRPLPILITIRNYIEAKKNHGGDLSLLDYLYYHAKVDLNLEVPKWFFEYYLITGEATILIDGLDELGDATQRAEARDQILSLQNLYNKCLYIITSRIVGYRDAPLPHNKFKHLIIDDFTDEQIDKFIEFWYKTKVDYNPRERKEGIDSLQVAIRRSERVKLLARNPLLLTLIALVHRIEAELPNERVVLYAKCTEALTATRDKSKKIIDLEMPDFRKRRYLEHLAFWLQTREEKESEGRTLVKENELLSKLINIMKRDYKESGEAEEMARTFIDHLKRRTGLLVETGERMFGFVHLTFQEYLAACYIKKQYCEPSKLTDEIKKRLGDHEWEEVILLLFGELTRESYHVLDQIAIEILSSSETKKGGPGVLTLGRAIRDSADFSQKIKTEILSKLKEYWYSNPSTDSPYLKILNEIVNYDIEQKKLISKDLLEDIISKKDKLAIGAVYLHYYLFEDGKKILEAFKQRSDYIKIMSPLLYLRHESPLINSFAFSHGNMENIDRFLSHVMIISPVPYETIHVINKHINEKCKETELMIEALIVFYLKLYLEYTSEKHRFYYQITDSFTDKKELNHIDKFLSKNIKISEFGHMFSKPNKVIEFLCDRYSGTVKHKLMEDGLKSKRHYKDIEHDLYFSSTSRSMKHLAEYFSDFEEVEINEYVEYLIGRLDDFTEKFAEFFSNLKLHKEEPLFWFKQEYITNLNYLVDQYYWGNVIEDLCEKFGKNLGTIFRGHLRRLSLSAYLQLGVHSTPPNVVTIRRLVRQYFRNGIFNLFNLMYWDFYIHSYISSYDRSLKDSVGALLLTLALNINCFLGIEPENNTWRKLISNVALGKDFLIDLVFIIYRNEYNREDSRDIEELEKLLSTKSDKNKSILRRVGLLNQNKKSYR